MTHPQATAKVLRRFSAMQALGAEIQFSTTSFHTLKQNAQFLESIFPEWVFVLCRLQHAQLQYVGANCGAILGYSDDYLKNLSPESYYGLVHPEDVKALHLSLEYLQQWVKQCSCLDQKAYRFVFHYRLLTPKGYLYIQDEKRALQNQSGEYTHFSLLKNTTHEQPFTHVKLEIYKASGDYYRKIDEYVSRLVTAAITAREKEILQCIGQGMSSKEIAAKLSISLSTVRNHRTNIFQKAQAQNMVQLLRYAQSSGWI